MELPRRERGDELLRAGEMVELRRRLRHLTPQHDLTTVIACAFDHRTRMLPFLYADMHMVPAGVRAIGSAMADIGCDRTRIVLQQWNRQFRPSQMQLDGRVPDLFMVSSMWMHSAECEALIRDAQRIDPAHRPLIIAGGSKTIYEPWSVFSDNPVDPWGADVAVTGEEFVLLELLEVLLTERAGREPLRQTFERCRDDGALDGVSGLVYARTDRHGIPCELVDTGIQRLLGDFDELPHPVLGYRLLEPPSRHSTLSATALPANRVRHHGRIASLVLTQGCRFSCPYCPIPAYHQRQLRGKSPERIVEEFERLNEEYGFAIFFGTDDNFFSDDQRAIAIGEALSRSKLRSRVYWATEATVHDTLKVREHLPTMRQAGLVALWMGVEDISGELVRKGQNEDKTLTALHLLRDHGIMPITMMMHFDNQPLFTLRGQRGLLNQLGLLRQAGAPYMQVLMLSPSPGSKSYEEMFTSGVAYESADGHEVEPRMTGGTYVVASQHPRPWQKQLNLLAANAYFFNPLRFLAALFRPRTKRVLTADGEFTETRPNGRRRRQKHRVESHFMDAGLQAFGMWGTILTCQRTLGWTWRLLRGRIQRHTTPPTSTIPMRDIHGDEASHALPGTPQAEVEQVIPLSVLGD